MPKSNNLPIKLTVKENKFCQEYLKDFKRTQAVIRAGYSKNNARRIAVALMEKPHITDHLIKLQTEMAEKHDLTPDGIILNLKNIRNTSLYLMSLEVKKADSGDKLITGNQPSKNFAAVATVAMRANELIGQHIGMWPKTIELDHNVKFNEQEHAENEKRVIKLLDGLAYSKSEGGHETPRLGKYSKN